MYADMICDVMPPIPEDGGGNGTNHEGTGSDNGEEAEANIEQLMVSMLEERDKVMHDDFPLERANATDAHRFDR